MTSPRPTSGAVRRRAFVIWIMGAWIALSGAGASLHALAEGALVRGIAGGPGETAIKTAANLCDVATLGGWPLARRIAARLSLDALTVAVIANAVGLAVWFAAFALALALRRRLLSRRAVPGAGAGPAGEQREARSRDSRISVDLSRRRLLVDASFGAIGLTGAGTVVRAAVIEPCDLVVARVTIPIRGLPSALDGLRAVQISDTHLGPHVACAHIARAVEQTLALRPDVVLLTGDYIHSGSVHIGPAADLFRPLTAPGAAPIGVLGVLGNHDWYGDGPATAAALRAIGVRMIDNARMFVDAASRRLVEGPPVGPALCIAGLGDLLEDGIDPTAALGGVDPETPRLVLAHNPDTAEHPRIKKGPRIDLMLSGHTHGGQVSLPFIGPPIVPSAYGAKYAGGLVQGPSCPVLVSRGVGVSVLPIRLGVPPEIVEITLRCA